MAKVKWIKKAEIADGKGGKKVVRPGDWVEVIPVGSCVYKTENDKNLHGELLDLMREVIGDKAAIEAIGQFPDREILLYFKTPQGIISYTADDFQAV